MAEECTPCIRSTPADMADWKDLREAVMMFGSDGQRWQLFVHGGLLRALALSTYYVLLTEPWCHHRPLVLTACHHVTLELMVKGRTVNTRWHTQKYFYIIPVWTFLPGCLNYLYIKASLNSHKHFTDSASFTSPAVQTLSWFVAFTLSTVLNATAGTVGDVFQDVMIWLDPNVWHKWRQVTPIRSCNAIIQWLI